MTVLELRQKKQFEWDGSNWKRERRKKKKKIFIKFKNETMTNKIISFKTTCHGLLYCDIECACVVIIASYVTWIISIKMERTRVQNVTQRRERQKKNNYNWILNHFKWHFKLFSNFHLPVSNMLHGQRNSKQHSKFDIFFLVRLERDYMCVCISV